MQQAARVHSDDNPGTSPGNLNDIPARLIHFAQAISTFERHEVETIVERLIAMLDQTDGDPDYEDDDPAGDALDKGESSAWPEGESAMYAYEDDCNEDDDVSARAVHRDRIRATRCIERSRGRISVFQLARPAAQIAAVQPW